MSRKLSIKVVTECSLELVLLPVAMSCMPSERSDTWLAFIDRSLGGYAYPVALLDIERIQAFMIAHQSECLSDGNRTYTVYGRSLVRSHPDAVEALLELCA